MKAILIIFVAFQLDSGAASSQVEFNDAQACEAARVAMVKAFTESKKEALSDDRRRIFAHCATL